MEELKKELSKVWNPEMVDHCLKSSKYIKIDDYFVDVCNPKPRIEKRLWFDDEQKSPEKTKEYFLNYNYKNMPRKFNADENNVYIATQYYRQPADCKLANITTTRFDDIPSSYIKKLNADEITLINNAVEEVNTDYKKRLETYWKKYETKIHCSGYWVNR